MTAKLSLNLSLKRGIYQTCFLKQTSWLANTKHPADPRWTKPLGQGKGLNIFKGAWVMLSCKERGLMTLKISLICKPNEIQLYTTNWFLKIF